MPTKSNDLAKAQDRVEKLREKVAEARAERDSGLRGDQDALTAAALDAEADKLEAELAQLEDEKQATANDPILEIARAGGASNQEPESPATTSARRAGKE